MSIQGMTGFGSAEGGGFRVEIRSLNHRFLDVVMRMPPQLAKHEMPLRDAIKENFKRGRVEVYVSASGDGITKLRADEKAAAEVCAALRELKEKLSLTGDVGLDTVAAWRDVIIQEEADYDPEDLYETFMKAVALLKEMRAKEGGALALDVSARAGSIEEMGGRIAALSAESADGRRRKFIEKVRDLLHDEAVDEGRLIEEAGAYVEKTDISEELTRIKGHVEHFRKILADGDTIGRRLDFLLQELIREANTVASKSDDMGILGIVVELKAEIERVREQVQNIQ